MAAIQQVLASLKAAGAPPAATMTLSGAGTAAANDVYTESGANEGKPQYFVGVEKYIQWNGFAGKWNIFGDYGGTLWYEAYEDVATPNLVSSWSVSAGDSPAPTVTAG